MVPSDYIEQCHMIGVNHLMTYEYFQDAIDFCLLYSTDTKRCFRYMGTVFYSGATNNIESMENCEMIPEEFKDDCIEGSLSGIHIAHVDTEKTDQNQSVTESSSSSTLPYLFIILSLILFIAPLIYYLHTKKQN